MIDTHAHLFLDNFKNDITDVIERAKKAGIKKIFNPNVDVSTIEALLKLAKDFSGYCVPLMGLHPESVDKDFEKSLEIIFEQFKLNNFAGVGEIGIDLYWDKTTKDLQIEAFKQQVEFAISKNLPIVIHTREAFAEVFSVVDKLWQPNLRGIFHCFSGTLDDAMHILDYKTFKIGIGGVITYKKNNLANIITQIPLKSIVLETDAPFLTPVPYRGKRNEPILIIEVLNKISEIIGESFFYLERVFDENAEEIFR